LLILIFCVFRPTIIVYFDELGLWGIFWFHEIRGQVTIILWLASSLVTLFGVLLLSHEHVHGAG